MKKGRDVRDYIVDIVTQIENLENFTEGFDFETFEKDKKTMAACIRALEVIGEVARQIDEDFKKNNYQIPWSKMIGMRNILIHGYFEVSNMVVWKTIKENIPEIKCLFERILTEMITEDCE